MKKLKNLIKLIKNSHFLLQTLEKYGRMFDGEERSFSLKFEPIKKINIFWRNFQNGKECKSCD